jgi:uncharacterized protein (TIGR01777 family)
MRVFVTGGTGLVGSLLVKRLRERGDDVTLLSRRAEAAQQFPDCKIVVGDPTQPGPWMDAIAECDAVVHLAGEGIFNRRWSQAFKDLIYSSRIKSTDNIVAALGKAATSSPLSSGGEASGVKGKVLINASAIGIYGPHGDEELSEDSLPGNDFLAKVCTDWEKAAQAATVHGARVVLLRTGIVLDKNGGALKQMLTPFKMFAGGPVGSGKQWMSWIHNEDEVGLILFALDHSEISGPLNATAPNPVTNRDFATALGKALGRPSFFPTPGFVLSVMLGESAQIVTSGQRVLPKKALAAGYAFKFTDVEAALRDLLGN